MENVIVSPQMAYGKLGSSQPPQPDEQSTPSSRRRRRFILIGLLAALFLVASAASIAVLARSRARSKGPSLTGPRPSEAISRTCRLTRYPELCVSSLLDFPGAVDAKERDLVHISVNVTLRRVGRAVYGASAIVGVSMDTHARAAYEDCMELLDSSMDQLSRSLSIIQPSLTSSQDQPKGASDDEDVLTWLSAALTNHDTCSEGLDGVADGYVKEQMQSHLKDLTELASNCLAIFAASSRNQDFSGVPIENKRRKLLSTTTTSSFPQWVEASDRRLLQMAAAGIQADMVVSKDGSGGYTKIGDAVKAAAESSPRRIIIYVKAGRYEENIKVGRKKTNLMFIGDGKDKTVVSGFRSVADGYTTFHTATFAATGAGFIMKDMTIENVAGPEKHQAVALRVGADRAVVYSCSITGYQDTLYVHSQRQFFRECDVSGTVDFVFGNAAVVLQRCSLWARRPMAAQKNTITAQNRKDPNQNTGISIHGCSVLAAPDLDAGTNPTYLGRPWKMYSRTVYMMSYMGGHVDPAGWLEWNGAFALDTLYYGEYMNYGPGAGVAKRVTWPGYRVIKLAAEASKFTVSKFIRGSSWLPSTGVAFLAGLSA